MSEPIKTGDRATIIAGALGDKGPNVPHSPTYPKSPASLELSRAKLFAARSPSASV